MERKRYDSGYGGAGDDRPAQQASDGSRVETPGADSASNAGAAGRPGGRAVRWLLALPAAYGAAAGLQLAASSAAAWQIEAGTVSGPGPEFTVGVCAPAAAFTLVFVWLAGRLVPSGGLKVGAFLAVALAMAAAMEVLAIRGPVPAEAIGLALAKAGGAAVACLGLLRFGRPDPLADVYAPRVIDNWGAGRGSGLYQGQGAAQERPSIGERMAVG